jgi:hypothetical protein
MKTAEDTEDPDNPEGDNQMEYSSDSCTAQVYEQQQKITCKNLCEYRDHLTLQNIR